MNIALLRKVKAQILAEPRQVIMENWFTTSRNTTRSYLAKRIPNCGTAGCIGGWAIAIQRQENPKQSSIFVELSDELGIAGKVLKISGKKAARLFYVEDWPFNFIWDYNETKPQTIERARVIAKRIDAFIESKGKI